MNLNGGMSEKSQINFINQAILFSFLYLLIISLSSFYLWELGDGRWEGRNPQQQQRSFTLTQVPFSFA